jgi:hypothetical protein
MSRRWLALAALGLSCGSPPSPAPGAVVNATPPSFCADRETVIELDSSGTSPHLTLVPVAPDPSEFPLAIEWSLPGHLPVSCARTNARPCIEGDPMIDHTREVLEVGRTSTISVRVSGDRPLEVALRVKNARGGVGEAHVTVPVTLLDDNGLCPLPAPE